MEYEVENDTERRQALQRFYEEYDAVCRKYGLMMSMHMHPFLMIAGSVFGRAAASRNE